MRGVSVFLRLFLNASKVNMMNVDWLEKRYKKQVAVSQAYESKAPAWSGVNRLVSKKDGLMANGKSLIDELHANFEPQVKN